MQIPPMDQCKIVAGRKGLTRNIISINIIDSPDPGPWVSKGQLVLTTGYVFRDSPTEQKKLLRQLSSQGCAGLAIKFKRFLSVPPVEMIEEADRLCFPLIDIPYEMPLSELMSSVMKGILEHEHYQNRQDKIDAFFCALLRNSYKSSEQILTEGRPIGILPNCRYVVICATTSRASDPLQLTAIKNSLESVLSKTAYLGGASVITTKIDTCVFGLLQLLRRREESDGETPWINTALQVQEQIEQMYSEVKFFIGVSTPKVELTEITNASVEAQEAILVGQRVFPAKSSRIYQYEELKPYMLLKMLPSEYCEKYIDSYLETLKQFDEKNNSELVKTLECYLNFNGRSADCAQQLFVHRNTINFRLARIEDLLGVDLKDGETIFRLQLAIKLQNLVYNQDK